MICVRNHSLFRIALIAAVCALVLLFAQPASASDGSAAQTWARTEALPRLVARAVAAPERAEPLRALGAQFTDRPAAQTSALTDRNATFWSAAGSSRDGLHLALTLKIALLLADGQHDAAARHYALALAADAGSSGSGVADVLRQFARLFSNVGPADPLRTADRALDRRDFGLAALAYRVTLLTHTDAPAASRDLPGHYLYCLHRLGFEPPMAEAREKYLRTVAFPSIEAQSRHRQATDSRQAQADPN